MEGETEEGGATKGRREEWEAGAADENRGETRDRGNVCTWENEV